MTADSNATEHGRLLHGALDAFLTHGFHAVPLEELEHATGLAWSEIVAAYGDKEGLFLAAAEEGLRSGSVHAMGKQDELLAMIGRLERANNNPRLRAIHRQSLSNMRRLAEEGSSNP